MSNPLGRIDFFALETGEYLERLATLVATPSEPIADEFVRLCRALRGAALLAGPPAFTRTAAAYEAIAKAFRDGRLGWSPPLREQLGGAVEDMKRLVRRARDWNDTDAKVALQLAGTLEIIANPDGSHPMVDRSRQPDGLQPGVRAFVAREAAMVAGALGSLAHETVAPATEALQSVLRKMQSLRGLAALSDLPPLPELLDGIELAIGDLLRGIPRPPDSADLFATLARALTRAARDVAEHGKPLADAPEMMEAAAGLMRGFGRQDDVVLIDLLFAGGDTGAVLRRGTPPKREQTGGGASLERVTLAARLAQAGAQLERVPSDAGRLLLLYALLAALRGIVSPEGTGRDHVLSAISDAIHHGSAERSTARFTSLLRETADAMEHGAGETGDGTPRRTLDEIAADFRALMPTVRSPHSEPPGDDEPIISIDDLLAAPGPVVPPAAPEPIAAFAPAPPSPAVIDEIEIETRATETAVEPHTWFEQSFLTFTHLVRTRGLGPASLDELLGEPTVLPRGPIPGRTAAPTVATALADEGDIVPIEALLYRGRSALERANAVRLELEAAMRRRRADEDLKVLVRELLDLVPLALES